MTGQRSPRLLRVEVSLPETMVASIHRRGVSAGEFLEFAVHHIPIDELMDAFIGKSARATSSTNENLGSPAASSTDRGEGSLSELPHGDATTPASTGSLSAWTSTALPKFFETIEADSSFVDGLALLAAYAKRGPSPSSSELAVVCGFTDQDKWTQALRSTKNGLNSQARRMGLPSVFLRPQTVRSERVHPLDPTIYAWIREWFKDPIREGIDPSQWGLRSNQRSSTETEGGKGEP